MDVGLVVALALGVVVVPIAVLASRSARANPREGYNGLTYANAKDERLWVPKRIGYGMTINFAHPWAWPVMVLLVGVPVIGAVIAIVLANGR